jgi:4-methyl-5(b-hydroxyethyl)-thiazole monophosphate biosynthesis
MNDVLILLADGFEELEFMAPLDILRRGGLDVKTASIGAELGVKSARGVQVQADSLLKDIKENYQVLLLPGGMPGTENLQTNPEVIQLIRHYYDSGKYIAAICAAPKILAEMGLLKGRSATSYPSVQAEVESRCKKYLEANVVIDGPIITSRSAGTSHKLGFALLEILKGRAHSNHIRAQMLFDRRSRES